MLVLLAPLGPGAHFDDMLDVDLDPSSASAPSRNSNGVRQKNKRDQKSRAAIRLGKQQEALAMIGGQTSVISDRQMKVQHNLVRARAGASVCMSV